MYLAVLSVSGFGFEEEPTWFEWFKNYRATMADHALETELIPRLTDQGIIPKLGKVLQECLTLFNQLSSAKAKKKKKKKEKKRKKRQKKLSSKHHPYMTEILLKGRKIASHQSIKLPELSCSATRPPPKD